METRRAQMNTEKLQLVQAPAMMNLGLTFRHEESMNARVFNLMYVKGVCLVMWAALRFPQIDGLSPSQHLQLLAILYQIGSALG
jgi:hypothetical protein